MFVQLYVVHTEYISAYSSLRALKLTIFSSCPGGFLRKIQRGAKKMSTIPMMVISQGKPMFSAMDPPMEGPVPEKQNNLKSM